MTTYGTIRINGHNLQSTKLVIQKLKAILDRFKLPYVLDDVSFHNTLLALNRVKTIHNTDVWKVEKDGSVSLKNRFGHSGRFEYRHLIMPSLLEFQFVDLSILSGEEAEFLSSIIYKVESVPEASTNKRW